MRTTKWAKQLRRSVSLGVSVRDRRASDIHAARPFRDGVSLTVERHSDNFPCVVCLSSGRRPSAVIWLIVEIVVDSVKRHPLRLFPHISKEILEYLPAWANSDPACAVRWKIFAFRVATSFPHMLPRSIGGGSGHSVRTCDRVMPMDKAKRFAFDPSSGRIIARRDRHRLAAATFA